MLNEVAKKWVAALRSGTYKQGRLKLRDREDNYCCLGVLCDLAVKEGVIPAPVLTFWSSFSYQEETGSLPVEVRDWAGLKTCAGSFDNKSLMELNDFRIPFVEIAAIIKSEPEGLFFDTKTETIAAALPT